MLQQTQTGMAPPEEISDLKARLDEAKERAAKRYQECRLQTRRADHAEKELAQEKWKRTDGEMKAIKLFNSYKTTIAQLEKEKTEGQWAATHGEQIKAYQAKATQLETDCNAYRKKITQLKAEKTQDKETVAKSLQQARAAEKKLWDKRAATLVQGGQHRGPQGDIEKQVEVRARKLMSNLREQAQNFIIDQKLRHDTEMQQLRVKCNQEEQKTAALQRQVHQLNQELSWYKQHKQQQAHDFARQSNFGKNTGIRGGIPLALRQSPVQAMDQENKRRRLNFTGAFGTMTPESKRSRSSSGSFNPIVMTRKSFDGHDAAASTHGTNSQMSGFTTHNTPTKDMLYVQGRTQRQIPTSIENPDDCQHMRQIPQPINLNLGKTSSTRQIEQQQIVRNSVTNHEEQNTKRHLRKILPSTQRPGANQHNAVSLINEHNALESEQRSLLQQTNDSREEITDATDILTVYNKESQDNNQQLAVQFSRSLDQFQDDGMKRMDQIDGHQDLRPFLSSLQNMPQPSTYNENPFDEVYGRGSVQSSVPLQQAIPEKTMIITQQTNQNKGLQGFQEDQQMNTLEAHSDLSSFNITYNESSQNNPRVYQQQNLQGNNPLTPFQPMMNNGQMQILPSSMNQFTTIQTPSPFSTLAMNPAQGSVQNDIAPSWASFTLGTINPVIASSHVQRSANFDISGF